jgi:Fe-S-cluster containining protein
MDDLSDGDVTVLDVTLSIAGEAVPLTMPVPKGPTRPRRLLPVLRMLAEEIVDRGVARAHEEGETITCKAGCGACCRQLVPISKAEAHQLRALVDAMPEPRRTHVRARFADAKLRLLEGGMRDLVEGTLPEQVRKRNGEAYAKLVRAYFVLGIACPFLEDESCSIHADRPVICREYLVVSPVEHCVSFDAGMKPVPLAGRVSEALFAIEDKDRDDVGFVPLSVALDWAEAHDDAGRTRPGPQLVGEVLTALAPKAKSKEKSKKRRDR